MARSRFAAGATASREKLKLRMSRFFRSLILVYEEEVCGHQEHREDYENGETSNESLRERSVRFAAFAKLKRHRQKSTGLALLRCV